MAMKVVRVRIKNEGCLQNTIQASLLCLNGVLCAVHCTPNTCVNIIIYYIEHIVLKVYRVPYLTCFCFRPPQKNERNELKKITFQLSQSMHWDSKKKNQFSIFFQCSKLWFDVMTAALKIFNKLFYSSQNYVSFAYNCGIISHDMNTERDTKANIY